MNLLPEWAPNVHPMLVHFPLVLLMIAVLFDVIGLVITKFDWLKKSALLLYFLGTIAAAVAFITGKAAADGLTIPANVIIPINDHADWAEITLWFFSIYSILRLSIGLFFKFPKKIIIVPVVLVGLLGIYLLYQTGDHGAKLVFGYGLGTGNIIKSGNDTEQITGKEQISDTTFTLSNNGSWKLTASPDIESILSKKFKWFEGSMEALDVMYDPDESAIIFHQTKEAPAVLGFVYDTKINSVQITAQLNIDHFDGELELIHHFIDKNNYDFLGLNNGEISFARKSNGNIKFFEKEKFKSDGWFDLRVVVDGSHFRGYVKNKLIVHGHGSKPNRGSAGIKFSGTGSIGIKVFSVESL